MQGGQLQEKAPGFFYSPYAELLGLMKPLNREVYPLTRFFDQTR